MLGKGWGWLDARDLLLSVEQATIHRVALPLVVGSALSFVWLAEKASRPSGLRAFALEVHLGLRLQPVRPYGARLASEECVTASC